MFEAIVISVRTAPEWRAFEHRHPAIKLAWVDELKIDWTPLLPDPASDVTIHEEVLLLRELLMWDGRKFPVYAPSGMSAAAATVIIEEMEHRRHDSIAPRYGEMH